MMKFNFYTLFGFIYSWIDFVLEKNKKELYNVINTLPKGFLLEVGLGTGKQLVKYKNHKIFAIDNNRTMINIFKAKNPFNANVFLMDAEKMDFENQSFDYIVLSHVITVVNNPQNLFLEVNRVLKPNGKIIVLNHFTPQNPLFLVDFLFQPFAYFFSFKSYFPIRKLVVPPNLNIVKQQKIGLFNYYQLWIIEKHKT